VRDAKNMKDLSDELVWCKFTSIAWTNDSKGFFYSRYNPPKDQTIKTAGAGKQKLESPKLYYHRLG
jgi:prolyl oligopeptidase